MNALKRWGNLLILLALALLLPGGVCAAETAKDITAVCKVKTSEGKASHFLDEKISSTWGYESLNATVNIELPADAIPGALMIKWKFDPTGYTIEEYDAEHALIASRDQSCTFPNISSYYTLDVRTRYITLTMTAKDQRICTLRVYSAGEPDADTQIWDEQLTKTDLLVVSTHQDDELIFFGGTIPYYNLVEGRPTQVVYMADCSRSRREDALKGLWVMGVRTYPEFINLLDERIKSYDQTLADWGGADNVTEQLVERIRRFRPEVIVTHDLNGEYGHNQHKVTARLMQDAIEAAADPARYPVSAQLYGTWQTKKLYLHLYAENQLYMDWETPYEQLGGMTPMESAQLGYSKHVSQHKYYQVRSKGQYDNALFGLAYSTVGLDTEGKNDMFEHIEKESPRDDSQLREAPRDTQTQSAQPTEQIEQATAEPAPSDTPDAAITQPTEQPEQATAEPAPSDTPDAPSVQKNHNGLKWVLGVGLSGLACAAALRQREINRKRERERRRRAVRRARSLAKQRAQQRRK